MFLRSSNLPKFSVFAFIIALNEFDVLFTSPFCSKLAASPLYKAISIVLVFTLVGIKKLAFFSSF